MSTTRTTNTTQSQSGQQSGATQGDFTGSSQNQFSNQYDWQQMPDTQDITALRGYREQIDPSIGAGYSRKLTNLRSSYQNPLGAYTTPAMRDAALRSQEGDLEQDYGQAQRAGYNDAQQRTGARLGSLASLTSPRLTQTGGTSSETSSGSSSGTSSETSSGSGTGRTTQSDPLLPTLIQGAAGIGAAAM